MEPAATVTVPALKLAAAELLEANVTTVPLGPAGEVKVTVRVEFATPPKTDVGESATELTTAGLIARDAVADEVPRLEVIVALVVALTAAAVNVNVPLVVPAATVTLFADNVTAGLELEMETTEPVAGALPLRVTVPVTTVPRPP